MRTFLLLPLLVALGPCACGPSVTRAVHGPLVGHTTSRTASIWLRTGTDAPLRLRYGPAPDQLRFRTAVRRPGRQRDFTVVFRLSGLRPNTRYFYHVEAVEPVGRVARRPSRVLPRGELPSFRTAPEGPSRVRIAFGSCARFGRQPIFRALLQTRPDLLLMLGDNVYANTADPERMRRFYRWSRERRFFDRLIARTPTLAIWDDHDFLGNNTDGRDPRRRGVLRVFREYWANPSYGLPGVPGVFHSAHFGEVEIFMLDVRYHRGVGSHTMLGAEQLAWLFRALTRSTAKVKIIASGSAFLPRGHSDSWSRFRAERDHIFRFVMQRRIRGVILISGDLHRPVVLRHRVDVPSSYPLYELIASPFANGLRRCRQIRGVENLFCGAFVNFGLLLIDTQSPRPSLTYELRDEHNRVRFRRTIALDELQPRP